MKRRAFILLLAFFAMMSRGYSAPVTIWIDTDPSIGSPLREVDDAFALLLAFHSPELRIAGISTTYGNASLKRTTEVARDLIRRFGADAGVSADVVHAGANSAGDLGRASAASDALAHYLSHHDKVTYIALAPLTDLATFLKLHPSLHARIERVYFVGGKTADASLGFGPSERFRIHDANVFKDPAAVRMVVASGIPICLTPIETSSHLIVTNADRRRMSSSGMAGRYLAERIYVWLWFWTGYVRAPGGPVFDGLPIIATASPRSVNVEKRFAKMNPAGELIVSEKGGRAVQWCSRFNHRSHEIMLSRICAQPR